MSSSSPSHSDPDGIVVIEESEFVVLNEEDSSDTSSFQSAADSEIVVLEEEDTILDLAEDDDDDGLGDDGLLVVLGVRHSSGLEEEGTSHVSNSVISGEIDNEKTSIEDGTPNLEESHRTLTRATGTSNLQESHTSHTQATEDDSKKVEEEVPGASQPRAGSGSLHASHSSSECTAEWCSCPSKLTAGLPRSRHQSYLLQTPRTWVREESPVTPVSEDPNEMAAFRTEFIRQTGECHGCRSHNTSFGDLLSRDPRAFGIEIIPSAFVGTPEMHLVLKETEKSDSTTPASDAPAEIVLVVDDRGYARMMSGSFVVPRSYYFGLVTIQEPFDPQWDLDWCREAFFFMATYEEESMLSAADAEKESLISIALNAVKSFWRDMLNSGNRSRRLVVLTSWSN